MSEDKSQPSAERVARYKRGQRSEWIAAVLLSARGYRVLNMRYKTPVGEVDIVARRGGRIAFVEVKQRQTQDDALLSITPKLQQRVQRAAALWLRHNAPDHQGEIGFDVFVLVPRRWPLYMKDAFDHR